MLGWLHSSRHAATHAHTLREGTLTELLSDANMVVLLLGDLGEVSILHLLVQGLELAELLSFGFEHSFLRGATA